ncbi:MAG: DEAD/DEAH box helicase family protein [Halomonas sp.]|nr:DEAD/DEAH box helicase family protein [Halomonas sp.]
MPFHDGGQWQARYYQHNAITRALEAIAAGRQRVLLTLATGTGKTAIAFQLAWKLFHSRWNLAAWRGDENTRRRPRILADQAYNSFSAFPEDALVRIVPDAIRKRGRVPKNGNLFFTDLAQHWWTPIYAIIRASKASGLNVRKASACIKVSKTALYAALKASKPDA